MVSARKFNAHLQIANKIVRGIRDSRDWHPIRIALASHAGGFTFVETIVSIAVLVFLAVFISSGLVSFRESAALDQAADEALELLREARSKTLGSEFAVAYGVHFATTSMTLFRDGAFSAGNPANIAVPLPSSVAISGISLSTTTGSVVFERLSGASPASGTVTFTAKRSSKSKQIQIFPSGVFLKR